MKRVISIAEPGVYHSYGYVLAGITNLVQVIQSQLLDLMKTAAIIASMYVPFDSG